MYDTDFDSYVPYFLEDRSSYIAGHKVTPEEWNVLWELRKIQGDYNAKTLYDIIQEINPVLAYMTDDVINIPMSSVVNLEETLAGLIAGELSAVSHSVLPLRDAADSHPQAAITGLTDKITALDNLILTVAALSGDLGDFTHAELGSRDAADGHPIAAITGLVTALAGKQTVITYGTEDPDDLDGLDGDVYIKIGA